MRLGSFPFVKASRLSAALIICHRHADVDAYCAAYGTRFLLKKLNPRVKVWTACPEGLGAPAERIAQSFPMPVTQKMTHHDLDLIVIVDTGHAGLLKEWVEVVKGSKAVKITVDHHPIDDSIRSLMDYLLVDTDSSSACEMVHRLLKAKKIKPNLKVSKALLAGILYDSQHLRLARRSTISSVNDLCARRDILREVKDMLRLPRDRSEVVARLKSAQRLKLFDSGGWLIAVTRVGSFHASAARALVGLGADVAIVTDEKNDETRATLRGSEAFEAKTGIHLGTDIASSISKSEGGIGGGHPTAASMAVESYRGDLAVEVLKTLSEKIGASVKPIT
ncbi:MAG: DHH family phosphoesterase [Thaumarchaeota archaeon]|nr:DHH family phosphoesterase [Nitrososphaerota archaeon]